MSGITAKIREALEGIRGRVALMRKVYPKDFGTIELLDDIRRAADEALALLDAERPSVPMAMRDELGVWMQGGSAKANEILTHHGFDVKE